MLRVVVIARCEGLEAAGKTVNGGVEAEVVVVWEDNVEIAIELCRSEFAAAFRYEGKAY